MSNLKYKQSKNIRVIKNKFGVLKVDLSRQINFSKGLIGISDASEFVLTKCPNDKFKNFKLLQSLQNDEITFLVYPISMDNNYYQRIEIEQVCKLFNIKFEDAVIVLIASIILENGTLKLVVNTKAPVFIDSDKMQASQYVMPNPNLEIQHSFI